MEHTITITGAVRSDFGGEPWGDPQKPYGYGPSLFIEHFYGDVKVGVVDSTGRRHVVLNQGQIYDLIVSLEEALHKVPLVADSAHGAE